MDIVEVLGVFDGSKRRQPPSSFTPESIHDDVESSPAQR